MFDRTMVRDVVAAVLVASLVCVASTAWAVSLTAFGQSHTPLGNATLNMVGSNLVVGNLGSSGNDGVAIAPLVGD